MYTIPFILKHILSLHILALILLRTARLYSAPPPIYVLKLNSQSYGVLWEVMRLRGIRALIEEASESPLVPSHHVRTQ